MESLNSQATLFASGDHFDKDKIHMKAQEVKDRYEKLRAPMTSRKQKLTEAQTLQQFLRDVEDEEDWIREKEPIAASTNRGERRWK
jgi:spectrin alpha